MLSLAPGVRCLEIGGGRGSIARWLCEYVGPKGRVTATDLDTGFLSGLSRPDLDVLRHDVTRDEFPESSFELVHVGAVLTAAEAARLAARLDEPDFMACGFAFIGAWGRRDAGSRT